MAKNKEIDINNLAKILNGNKKLIGIITGVITALALIYCFVATPIYTASATINPPKLSDAGTSFSQVISGLSVLGGNNGGFLQKTDADVATAMMKTNSIREMVATKFNLEKVYNLNNKELIRERLRSQVYFTTDVKSGFLSINVDDPDPKFAAQIANYYTVALGQLINNVAYARANQRFNFYQEQLKVALINLNNSESALKGFLKANGIIAGQQTQVIANISMQMQVKLVAAQSQLQSMSYYVSPENSDYQALVALIASYRSQLDRLNNQNNDEDVTIPSGMAPELANKYVNLMREYTFKELVYGVMLKQAKASQLDAQSEITPLSIQVIDSAMVPSFKSKPRRARIVLSAFLFGLILGCSICIVRNYKLIFIERSNEK